MLPLTPVIHLAAAGESCWDACSSAGSFYGGRCAGSPCADTELCCRSDMPAAAGCAGLGCVGEHCCADVASAEVSNEGEHCIEDCVDPTGEFDPACRSGFCGSGGFCCMQHQPAKGFVGCGDAGCRGYHCCVSVVGESAPVLNEHVDCWSRCLDPEGESGGCSSGFCGSGLCCRGDLEYPFDDPVCGESGCWGYHCCVLPGSEAAQSLADAPPAWVVAAVCVASALLLVAVLLLLRTCQVTARARKAAGVLLEGHDFSTGTPPSNTPNGRESGEATWRAYTPYEHDEPSLSSSRTASSFEVASPAGANQDRLHQLQTIRKNFPSQEEPEWLRDAEEAVSFGSPGPLRSGSAASDRRAPSGSSLRGSWRLL